MDLSEASPFTTDTQVIFKTDDLDALTKKANVSNHLADHWFLSRYLMTSDRNCALFWLSGIDCDLCIHFSVRRQQDEEDIKLGLPASGEIAFHQMKDECVVDDPFFASAVIWGLSGVWVPLMPR